MKKNKRVKTPVYKNEQPCWSCRNCINGCNWARDRKPVDGWVAERKPYRGTKTINFTYKITYCPEYINDGK